MYLYDNNMYNNNMMSNLSTSKHSVFPGVVPKKVHRLYWWYLYDGLYMYLKFLKFYQISDFRILKCKVSRIHSQE